MLTSEVGWCQKCMKYLIILWYWWKSWISGLNLYGETVCCQTLTNVKIWEGREIACTFNYVNVNDMKKLYHRKWERPKFVNFWKFQWSFYVNEYLKYKNFHIWMDFYRWKCEWIETSWIRFKKCENVDFLNISSFNLNAENVL